LRGSASNSVSSHPASRTMSLNADVAAAFRRGSSRESARPIRPAATSTTSAASTGSGALPLPRGVRRRSRTHHTHSHRTGGWRLEAVGAVAPDQVTLGNETEGWTRARVELELQSVWRTSDAARGGPPYTSLLGRGVRRPVRAHRAQSREGAMTSAEGAAANPPWLDRARAHRRPRRRGSGGTAASITEPSAWRSRAQAGLSESAPGRIRTCGLLLRR
jgi:hypothetical protein